MNKKVLEVFERIKIKNNLWFSEDEIGELNIDSYEKAKKYISQRAYQSLRPQMDNVAWNEVLRNKLFTIQSFRAGGIRSCPFLGFLNSRDGFCNDGNSLRTAMDLSKLLESSNTKSFAMKHVVGGTGQDVYIMDYMGNGKYKLIDETIFLEKDIDGIISKNDKDINGYIVEKRVFLHDSINQITSGGLASLRVVSLRCASGDILIQGAYIKLGRLKGLTDHAVAGGVLAPVCMDSGLISKGIIYKKGSQPAILEVHPDSGVDFTKICVPFWGEIIEMSKKAHNIFPGIHFIGWDVIPSSNGAVMIEGNVGNVMSNYQMMFGPLMENGMAKKWRDELNCELPDGTLSWRINHWDKGRRLSDYERYLSKLMIFLR